MKRMKCISLRAQLILYVTVFLALHTIGVEIYSHTTVRRMVEKQVALEAEESVILAANNVDSVFKSLIIQLMGLYQDGEFQDIVKDFSESGSSLEQQKELNTRFVELSNENLQVVRVYSLDTQVYKMLLSESETGLFNFSIDSKNVTQIVEQVFDRVSEDGLYVEWFGLLNNIDNYIHNPNESLVVIGKQLEVGSDESDRTVLLVGMRESSLRKMMAPHKESERKRFLLDDQHNIISATVEDAIGHNIDEYLDCTLLGNKSSTTVGVETEFGTAVIAVEPLNNNKWKIVDILPYDIVLADMRYMNSTRLMIDFLFLVVLAIIAVCLADSIVKPLNGIKRKMLDFRPGIAQNKEDIDLRFAAGEIVQIYECYNRMTDNISELLEENLRIQKKKHEFEFKAIQAQLKPHFIFNTLTTIRCAVNNGHSEKAVQMLLKLSQFLRNIIGREDEVVCLKEELNMLRLYIDLLNLKSCQEISLIIEVPQHLQSLIIPKYLLQPIVENAVVHGLREKDRGIIKISASECDSKILLLIRDNGSGIDSDPLQNCNDGQHFGVFSVKERIKLYYGNEGSVSYKSKEGTEVSVIIPNITLENGNVSGINSR